MDVLELKEPRPVTGELSRHLGVVFRAVLSPDECARYTRGVYEGRRAWTSNFGGIQFTLGRAFYTHLEQGHEEAYFDHARESDRNVERYVPGLQARMNAWLATLLGEEVTAREDWCGPGIHIFPAGKWVAKNGGDIHYDTEGLTDEQIEARAPAITCVLMLQPPEEGGELRLWDKLFDGEHQPKPGPEVKSVRVRYGPGDLLVLDSFRLHQICTFPGKRDRVSMTAHAVKNEGRWESWF